ncbi:MAG: H-NS histone family protein, partial [Aquabacterium sp.]
PKYRNAQTGETWTGRGLQPKWVQAAVASGKKLEDFAI